MKSRPTQVGVVRHAASATGRISKVTRQGVRDLGSGLPRSPAQIPPDCDHRRMRYCCHPRNCGHLVCPDCPLSWDEGAQK